MSEAVRNIILKCLGLGWAYLIFNSLVHISKLGAWWQQEKFISTCFISLICCQGMKPILARTEKKEGKTYWHRLWEPGGMPSSHVAVVVTLLINVGRECGWSSVIFQSVTVFASIVIYDAVTLRNTVGHQSRLLNDLLIIKSPDTTRVPEKVGHNPLEALVGALIAIAVTTLLR